MLLFESDTFLRNIVFCPTKHSTLPDKQKRHQTDPFLATENERLDTKRKPNSWSRMVSSSKASFFRVQLVEFASVVFWKKTIAPENWLSQNLSNFPFPLTSVPLKTVSFWGSRQGSLKSFGLNSLDPSNPPRFCPSMVHHEEALVFWWKEWIGLVERVVR